MKRLLSCLFNLYKKIVNLGRYKPGCVVRYRHIGIHGERHGPTFEGVIKYIYTKEEYAKGNDLYIPSRKYIYVIEFKNGSLDAVGDMEIL